MGQARPIILPSGHATSDEAIHEAFRTTLGGERGDYLFDVMRAMAAEVRVTDAGSAYKKASIYEFIEKLERLRNGSARRNTERINWERD